MSSAISQSSGSTSSSLIAQARSGDGDAWNRVAELYSPLVYGWARQAGLQDSDAADVMQDVFRNVARGLHGFQKHSQNDSFRGWLWVITRNQVRRFFNRFNSQPHAAGGTDAYEQLQQAPDFLDTESMPDDSRVRGAVVHRALEMIRHEFQERTWQSFWRLTVAGHSAADIAEDLNMNEKAVRQAKYRVLCRLKELLRDD